MLPRPAKRNICGVRPVTGEGSERTLQLSAGLEAHAFAGADLDRLAGARIAPHARRALADMERAEARNAEFLCLFELFRDHTRDRVDGLVGHRSRETGFLQRFNECLLAHRTLSPSVLAAVVTSPLLFGNAAPMSAEPQHSLTAGRMNQQLPRMAGRETITRASPIWRAKPRSPR